MPFTSPTASTVKIAAPINKAIDGFVADRGVALAVFFSEPPGDLLGGPSCGEAAALVAENLFLRKQIALFRERDQ